VSALVKRDFLGRYKGSVIGITWSLLTPLLMLAVYTFVFSVAFKARWGLEGESKAGFAIVLFCGMLVFNLFSECVNRAPGLILANPNFVKKVVFPLEIMPWVALASAMLHFLVGFVLLLMFCLVSGQALARTLLLFPIVLLPLALLTLGTTWILSALGVYLRDLSQVISIATTVLMFVSPVFYPVEALPLEYRVFMEWNPLGRPIEQMRQVVLWGRPPDWGDWLAQLALGALVFAGGFWWFQRSRKGFADVI